MTAALRLLLGQMGRGEQAPGELVWRPHVDQVEVADGRHYVIAEGADRGILLLGVVAGRGPMRDLGHHLARLELPLLAAAVKQLDVVVAVQLEVPVRVGREPVVVAAVQDDRVVVGDAALGQQLLEPGPVDEVPPNRILQVLLPVDLDRALDVALVIGAGVLVDLDEDDAIVTKVGLRPVSVYKYVRTAHA